MDRLRLIIIIVVIGIVLVPALIYLRVLPGRPAGSPAGANLTFWGIQDDSMLWQDAIRKFEENYPHIKVSYTRMNEATYESTLVDALAKGSGPDIFVLKSEWIIKHNDKTSPFPSTETFSSVEFSERFTDGLTEDLVMPDGSMVGLPLFVDTPLLFYNKDILNVAGIALPPADWEELASLSRQLTKGTLSGEITRSGLAMGTYRNVDRAFDIITSLILQKGDPIVARGRQYTMALGNQAQRAVEFYTSFADRSHQNFSWSARMQQSLDAFAQEEAVFAFGYAEDIKRVRAKNPHINLGILSFPQEKDTERPVIYHSYFFPTVSRLTPSPQAAWEFIFFVTLGEGAQLYAEVSGRTPARRDLLAIPPGDPVQSIGYRQALIAQGWPVPDDLPARRLFEDGIEAIVSRSQTIEQTLALIRSRLDQLLP